MPVEIYSYADVAPITTTESARIATDEPTASSPWISVGLFALVSGALLFVFRGLGTTTKPASKSSNGPDAQTSTSMETISDAADLDASINTSASSPLADPDAEEDLNERLSGESARLSSEISDLVQADPSRTHALVQDWLRSKAA